MVDLAMLQVVRDLVVIFGIIAGFSYYVMTVRNAKKARWKEILLERIDKLDDDFYNKWLSFLNGEWSTYQEWYEYRQEHPDAYGFVTYLQNMLNNIGTLLKDNMVDPDSLFIVYSPILIIYT